ncbi:MAG: Grx4 family monothiol glutaredoxin [Candidatus Kinetoplastibacterium crithidii]|nr:MAG: Grx4 family monothiol glutaredoxin [Candidatus Kinetoplastibacterium crithidii]
MKSIEKVIEDIVSSNRVVLFMKGTSKFPLCGFSGKAVRILIDCGISDIFTVNVLEDENLRQAIKDYSNWPTIPQLYIDGEFIGGVDIMSDLNDTGELKALLNKKK